MITLKDFRQRSDRIRPPQIEDYVKFIKKIGNIGESIPRGNFFT